MLSTTEDLPRAPHPFPPSKRPPRRAGSVGVTTSRCQVDTRIEQRRTPLAAADRAIAARRRIPRVTLHMLGEARCGGRHLVGWMLDLSVTGLFLRSPSPLPVGSRPALEFCLPETGDVVRCAGVVVSALEAGPMGPGGNRIEFTAMRPAHRSRVEAFVNRRLAASRHVKRVAGGEVSLLTGDVHLDDLSALPGDEGDVMGVDALPDVGFYLQELSDEHNQEAWNDVGTVCPDDLELLS